MRRTEADAMADLAADTLLPHGDPKFGFERGSGRVVGAVFPAARRVGSLIAPDLSALRGFQPSARGFG